MVRVCVFMYLFRFEIVNGLVDVIVKNGAGSKGSLCF